MDHNKLNNIFLQFKLKIFLIILFYFSFFTFSSSSSTFSTSQHFGYSKVSVSDAPSLLPVFFFLLLFPLPLLNSSTTIKPMLSQFFLLSPSLILATRRLTLTGSQQSQHIVYSSDSIKNLRKISRFKHQTGFSSSFFLFISFFYSIFRCKFP